MTTMIDYLGPIRDKMKGCSTEEMNETFSELVAVMRRHNVKIDLPTGRFGRRREFPHQILPASERNKDLVEVFRRNFLPMVQLPLVDYAQLELRVLAFYEGKMEQQMVECIGCREEFEVTQGEIDFLKEKFGDDFAMPRRCKPCRKANKERKKQQRR